MASLADMLTQSTPPSLEELLAGFTKKRLYQELRSVLSMRMTHYDKSTKEQVFTKIHQEWGNLQKKYMMSSGSAGPMAPSGSAGSGSGGPVDAAKDAMELLKFMRSGGLSSDPGAEAADREFNIRWKELLDFKLLDIMPKDKDRTPRRMRRRMSRSQLLIY